MTALAHVVAAGTPGPWTALGFAVGADGRIPFANGAIAFTGAPGRGLVALAVDGEPGGGTTDVDGVPIEHAAPVPPLDHPNGAFELDHVVVMTDSLERTSAEVERVLGLEQRRVRATGTVRQAFHRFEPAGGVRGCILELVERTDQPATALWGLVVNVADLDRIVDRFGPELIGRPKPAVQPGRRIATIRGAAGLGVAVALMTPG